MKVYLRYLKAVLRHKWFVFLECCKLGIPWLGIVHDLSKFLPSEFRPYAQYFYGPWGDEKPQWLIDAFDMAWLHHQHRNKHHWQRWLLTMDSARDNRKTIELPIPDRYLREMLADLRGMGHQPGLLSAGEFYVRNKKEFLLHPETRKALECKLGFCQKSADR